jgi:hypothetical protein
VVAAWGRRRKVVFSPKSTVCLLRGQPRDNDAFPTFYMGRGASGVPPGPPLARATGTQQYLGVPLRAYQPHAHTHSQGLERAYELDLPELRRLTGALASVFSIPGGSTLVSVPAWVSGLRQTVLAKALYPTPVVDVDYAALDSIVLRATTRLLGLPPATPSALIRWELRLIPTELQAHGLALRFAQRFAQHSWFYADITRPLLRANAHTAEGRFRDEELLRRGSIGRLTALLERYYRDLYPGEPVPTAAALWLKLGDVAPGDWHKRVATAIQKAFEQWHSSKLLEYPAWYREQLSAHQSRTQSGLPFYLKCGGNLARVAIRFKAPVLRIHQRDQLPARCAWCRLQPECGRHLLSCLRMPVELRQELNRVRDCIRREARLAADPYWFRSNRFILQCAWPHHNVATLSVVLSFLARLLAAYRLSTPVDSVSGHRPIWAVPAA